MQVTVHLRSQSGTADGWWVMEEVGGSGPGFVSVVFHAERRLQETVSERERNYWFRKLRECSVVGAKRTQVLGFKQYTVDISQV